MTSQTYPFSALTIPGAEPGAGQHSGLSFILIVIIGEVQHKSFDGGPGLSAQRRIPLRDEGFPQAALARAQCEVHRIQN